MYVKNAEECFDDIRNGKQTLWINNKKKDCPQAFENLPLSPDGIYDAHKRLSRFAPLLVELFSELGQSDGIIESLLIAAAGLKNYYANQIPQNIGAVLVKADHALPVAGSIKARGGIYAVLCIAEQIAMKNKIIDEESDYLLLCKNETKEFFSKYEISVGSTGNLGLSIGIMGSALGFNVTVHMSVEAKEWKKKRLRNRGVKVIEHKNDYTFACAQARKNAEKDPCNFFIDDENSIDLFMGYSVAALRLKTQLEDLSIKVDSKNPLFVYLPCGVGGAPGGITFGLKHVFGNNVHCFFVEPTQAPCMLLGMLSGKHSEISVYDVGLGLNTDADGLAVSRPSSFVGKSMVPLLSGIFTITDEEMYRYVAYMKDFQDMSVEPSSAASVAGPNLILNTDQGKAYLKQENMLDVSENINHVLWTTGGLFVPQIQHDKFYLKGKKLI